MTLRFTPEAEADLGEAFSWYSDRGASLGLEFLAALGEALDRINRFPQSAPEVHQGIRRALIHRFPYCLFYWIEPTGPVILGCFHASRDPRAWRVRAGV